MLRRAMAGYEARVEIAPKRQQELDDLSRDYAAIKERYDTLLKRYQDAQVAESLEKGQDVEQFRVLDPAIPPDRPAAPNRPGLLDHRTHRLSRAGIRGDGGGRQARHDVPHRR